MSQFLQSPSKQFTQSPGRQRDRANNVAMEAVADFLHFIDDSEAAARSKLNMGFGVIPTRNEPVVNEQFEIIPSAFLRPSLAYYGEIFLNYILPSPPPLPNLSRAAFWSSRPFRTTPVNSGLVFDSFASFDPTRANTQDYNDHPWYGASDENPFGLRLFSPANTALGSLQDVLSLGLVSFWLSYPELRTLYPAGPPPRQFRPPMTSTKRSRFRVSRATQAWLGRFQLREIVTRDDDDRLGMHWEPEAFQFVRSLTLAPLVWQEVNLFAEFPDPAPNTYLFAIFAETPQAWQARTGNSLAGA